MMIVPLTSPGGPTARRKDMNKSGVKAFTEEQGQSRRD